MLRRLIFASVLITAVVPAAWAHEAPVASFDESSRTWSISNGLVEAQFRLLTQGQFRWISLGKPGGKQWIANGRPATAPIFLTLDNVTTNATTEWTLLETRTEESERAGLRHVIRLRGAATPVEISFKVEMHPGQPFVRTSYSYRNLDSERHTVRAARFYNLRVNPEQRPIDVFYVRQARTLPNFETRELNLQKEPFGSMNVWAGAYAHDCTWLALRDSEDNGLAFGWEFNGRSVVHAQLVREADRLDVEGFPQDLVVNVPPGAEFHVPAAFIGLFKGDWDEAGYRTQRYVEAVLADFIPDNDFPYFMFNTWGYQQDIDEATLRRTAQIAARIGVEVFVVDLGWARNIGDWEDNRVKFPGGLRAFGDYVRTLGMKFGLHFVPVEASAEAPVLRENPDWTSSQTYYYYDAESICLSHRPVQQWLRESAMSMIRQYHPDWLTQDGENLVKVCTKTSHTHHAGNSNWDNSVNGLDAFIHYMRGRAPNTLWENNGDGGTMTTFEAVKNHVTFGGCDACYENPRRIVTWGMSYPFPPRFISRYMPEAPTKFTTRSSMFGGPWILMQRLHELSAEQIELLKEEGAIYKSLRGLIRDGKVYHLDPPGTVWNEAIQSFHEELDRGVVFVYRPLNDEEWSVIHPKGLRRAGRYRVSFEESAETYVESGSNLMSRGIKVLTPHPQFADIVYITGL